MDLFNGRYFYINKTLNIFMGLWPYHKSRYFIRPIWILLIISFSIPQIIGTKVNRADFDKLLLHIGQITFMTMAILKYITIVIANEKLKIMYDGIIRNWMMIHSETEKKILHDYSERGRQVTIRYIGVLMMVYVAFISVPILPTILDKIKPLPEPRPTLYILYGEFFIEDQSAHYGKIYVWDSITAWGVLMVGLAVDPMYMVCAYHCLGMYAILQHRLQKPNGLVVHDEEKDEAYHHLVEIIKTHNKILEFTSTIEASYSLCFLILLITHVVGVPIFSVIILQNLDDPINLIRYSGLFISLKFHLFCLCNPVQQLIDYSNGLFVDAYCNEWYQSSAKTKKILQIFMLRCTEPCTITAGGLVVMNMEIYLKITTRAVSYITVLGNFRE